VIAFGRRGVEMGGVMKGVIEVADTWLTQALVAIALLVVGSRPLTASSMSGVSLA
jgi:hypothetical protein